MLNNYYRTGKRERDFTIEQPRSCTLTGAQGNKVTLAFEPGTNVLFLRTATVFSYYDRSSFNTERTTKSTIDQNLRSHPSYIGQVSAHRFEWEETIETAIGPMSNSVQRVRTPKSTMTSATVLNYDKFLELYNMDLRRTPVEPTNTAPSAEAMPETTPSPPAPKQQNLPFTPAKPDETVPY